jgi:uncharacterized protein YutE (UPF0331/DUF86 family)
MTPAGFRNRLTHFYDEVTAEELLGVTRDDLDDLEHIAAEFHRAAVRLVAESAR